MFKSVKRFHLLTGIMCLAALAAYAADNPEKVAGTFKVAVVDVETAVKAYDRYKAEMEDLTKEFQPKIDALNAEEEALLKRQDSLKGNASLDVVAAQVARAEIEADYQKLQGRGSLLTQQVQRAKLVIRKEIVEDLNMEIGKIASEDDFHLVLRIDTESVAYSDLSLDITPKLIDRLNESYKKKP